MLKLPKNGSFNFDFIKIVDTKLLIQNSKRNEFCVIIIYLGNHIYQVKFAYGLLLQIIMFTKFL